MHESLTMQELLTVITDPQNPNFQTPETRPFCDTAADAITRFKSLAASYTAESAKGAAADAATLAGVSKAQIICLDITRQCLQHMIEWIEKQKSTSSGANLN